MQLLSFSHANPHTYSKIPGFFEKKEVLSLCLPASLSFPLCTLGRLMCLICWGLRKGFAALSLNFFLSRAGVCECAAKSEQSSKLKLFELKGAKLKHKNTKLELFWVPWICTERCQAPEHWSSCMIQPFCPRGWGLLVFSTPRWVLIRLLKKYHVLMHNQWLDSYS